MADHDPDCACIACKARSLGVRTAHPTYRGRSGDPWDGNPVAERIAELQAEGAHLSVVRTDE